MTQTLFPSSLSARSLSCRPLVAALTLSAAALGASAAGAATLTYGTMPSTPVAMPAADAISGEVYENVTGSIIDLRASPWLGTGVDPDAATSVYTSINRDAYADYTLGLTDSVSFVWGSPDTYNRVDFLRGGAIVDTFSLAAAMPAGFLAVLGNVNGGLFDTIRFASGNHAFEIANLQAAPVPLPAAGLMLIAGLGGLAALRRRQTSA